MFTGTRHTLRHTDYTDCYSLLLVVENVLLELLVPAFEFFELILQGSLVLATSGFWYCASRS